MKREVLIIIIISLYSKVGNKVSPDKMSGYIPLQTPRSRQEYTSQRQQYHNQTSKVNTNITTNKNLLSYDITPTTSFIQAEKYWKKKRNPTAAEHSYYYGNNKSISLQLPRPSRPRSSSISELTSEKQSLLCQLTQEIPSPQLGRSCSR